MAIASRFRRGSDGAVPIPFRGRDKIGDPVTIRAAAVDDAVEYLAHMQRIVAETPFMLQCDYDPLPPVHAQRRLFAQLDYSDNSLGLLAYRPSAPRRERVVGSLTLLGGRSIRTRHSCTLGMGIDQEQWGRGLGGLLLDAAVTWARRNPALSRMGLQVFEGNHAARELYLGRGFVEEGQMQAEVAVRGRWHDLIGMSLVVE